jgi:hypothetical protein
MMKCPECREEFSYGRRISCCNSIHFGAIFEDEGNHYQWNCNRIRIKSSNISYQKLISNKILEMKEVNKEKRNSYQWNCVSFLGAIEIASK